MTKLNNTKKWVYAAAMTGVIFAGAQYANSTNNYLANADANNDLSRQQYPYNASLEFNDQNGNSLGGITASSNDSTIKKSSLSYSLNYNHRTYDFTNQIQKDKNIPDYIQLWNTPQHYTLNQPTHTLTVNIVDGDTGKLMTSKDYTVTDFGVTNIDDLISHYSNNYSYSYSEPFNYETNYTVKLTKGQVSYADSTTADQEAEASYTSGANTSASITDYDSSFSAQTKTNEVQATSSASSSTASSSADSKSQSADSSAASSASSKASSSSNISSSSSETSGASQSSQTNSNVSSAESSNNSSQSSNVASSVASSMAEKKSEANNNNEKTSVIYDPVNPEEAKAGNNAGEPSKAESNKLPQTGDKTNQQAIVSVGVIAMIVGAVLGFFGLRRKDK
ncbi:LPXTG cell wall anchor domain-containing protein [Lactobacillus kunkeei]|uniref:LPXTG cell wall anchor domain-containing protein n=1 Tax=Apilactobacillus nanyangensis TaxID=2799579 RepID=A0ABT0HXC7_9LACO|nr:LPXTG cell wall anchor domain-containing protein [Apilactobacillus nanyangensis]MBC6388546.1 LPXTG cell wall anchor domain-containing protein [Apilactobacillus kunkeei]MCK8611575.1 LPXTG cell wall anchor domain-containing protein [Apilactobacillus nanyangensis]